MCNSAFVETKTIPLHCYKFCSRVLPVSASKKQLFALPCPVQTDFEQDHYSLMYCQCLEVIRFNRFYCLINTKRQKGNKVQTSRHTGIMSLCCIFINEVFYLAHMNMKRTNQRHLIRGNELIVLCVRCPPTQTPQWEQTVSCGVGASQYVPFMVE